MKKQRDMTTADILRLRSATVLSMSTGWPVWSGNVTSTEGKRFYLANMPGYHRIKCRLLDAANGEITEDGARKAQERVIRDLLGWTPYLGRVELVVSYVVVDTWAAFNELLRIRQELLNPDIRIVITAEQAKAAREWLS